MRVSAFTIGFLLFVPDLVPSPASADCTAAHLQSVGSVSLDEALGVAVAGNFAYVGADYAGFLVVDISDYRQPKVVGRLQTGLAVDVAVLGTYVYLPAGGELGRDLTGNLEVIDVSDPTSPRIVGSVATAGVGYGIALANGYAYVSIPTGSNSGAFQVIDVRDPEGPRLVASIPTHDFPTSVAVSKGYAYVGNGTGLLVIDLGSSSASPRIVAEVGESAFGIAIVGHYAYVGGGSDTSGLQVFDIANPRAPETVADVCLPGLTDPGEVAVSGNYAYFAASRLWAIDIADPRDPCLVSSYGLPFSAWGVDFAEPGYACVTGWISQGPADELDMVAITNPVSPPAHQSAFMSNAAREALRLPSARTSVLVVPNPVSRTNRVHFETTACGMVQVHLLDVSGRLVRSLQGGMMEAGSQGLPWDLRDEMGHEVAPGVYLARISTGGEVWTTPVVILK